MEITGNLFPILKGGNDIDITEVKSFIAKQIPVEYDGISYTVTACILRIYKGKWYYSLELKKDNYIVIVDMKKVYEEK